MHVCAAQAPLCWPLASQLAAHALGPRTPHASSATAYPSTAPPAGLRAASPQPGFGERWSAGMQSLAPGSLEPPLRLQRACAPWEYALAHEPRLLSHQQKGGRRCWLAWCPLWLHPQFPPPSAPHAAHGRRRPRRRLRQPSPRPVSLAGRSWPGRSGCQPASPPQRARRAAR